MGRCLLAVRWVFGLGLVAGLAHAQTPEPPSSGSHSQTAAEEQLPGAAAARSPAAGDKPLPRLEDLIALAQSRQSVTEELRKHYTYKQTVVADEFDSHGNKKGTHSDTYQTWMVKDRSVSQHLEHDGKPLPEDAARKEQDRIDREVAAIKDGSYKAPHGDMTLKVSNLLRVVRFTHERRVEVDGRPTIVFDYQGNPEAKASDIAEEIMKKLRGELWLDEQDAAVVRMQGTLAENFHVAGGLLANVKAGSHFDLNTSHLNGEIWFLHHMQAHADGRFLLVKGFDGDADVTFSDYRRMRTSVTILPGSQVIADDGQALPNIDAVPANAATPAQPAAVPKPTGPV